MCTDHKAVWDALARCTPDVQEEICLAMLRHLWGDAPVISLLDENLALDAKFWASMATPAVLAAYLPAIADELLSASAGKNVRLWMIKAASMGLPESVNRASRKKKPINKAFALTIERRSASSRSVKK